MSNQPPERESDPIAILQRWEDFGAHWEVLSNTGTKAIISLRRCDGGEEVQQLVCESPDLISWLGDRTASE